eukprot:TRINITY_DN21413_c1_g5_i1.p1 TRINITY_DN21413_c1_g5~~TRINITY_DN21413_c1_g5_i1.p1  ORF type:complete len:375 (-),score=44.40 TRINITY_DN21413_c1_g5_i1:441-1565(-)
MARCAVSGCPELPFRALRQLILACVVLLAACENDRPIIGILTQPLGTESFTGSHAAVQDKSYIAASYVKFLESAGARVVPLHFEASAETTRSLFQKLNGVLFPGGGTAFSMQSPDPRFRATAELLLSLTIEANKKGEVIPLHGTCLGFEMLADFVARDDKVICRNCYTTDGTPLPLNAAADFLDSRFFAGMPHDLLKAVQRENITENSHVSGVAVETFRSNTRLSDFFRVVSVNADPQGKGEFVSTMEARHFPISATQWHPEKNNFEWGGVGALGKRAIPHSFHAVQLSQWVANHIVSTARQSAHRFKSQEEEAAALIYNVAPVADPQGYFSQIYMWDIAPPNHTTASEGGGEAQWPKRKEQHAAVPVGDAVIV